MNEIFGGSRKLDAEYYVFHFSRMVLTPPPPPIVTSWCLDQSHMNWVMSEFSFSRLYVSPVRMLFRYTPWQEICYFSVVHVAVSKGKEVAVKIVNDKSTANDLLAEAEMMTSVNHNYSFLYIGESDQSYFLISTSHVISFYISISTS